MRLKPSLIILAMLIALLSSCGEREGVGSNGSTVADLSPTGSPNLGIPTLALTEASAVNFSINLSNYGNEYISTNFTLRVESLDASSAVLVTTDFAVTNDLSGGETEVFTIPYTPATSEVGTTTFRITIDSADVISESNESNNVFTSFTFNVASLVTAAPVANN